MEAQSVKLRQLRTMLMARSREGHAEREVPHQISEITHMDTDGPRAEGKEAACMTFSSSPLSMSEEEAMMELRTFLGLDIHCQSKTDEGEVQHQSGETTHVDTDAPRAEGKEVARTKCSCYACIFFKEEVRRLFTKLGWQDLITE